MTPPADRRRATGYSTRTGFVNPKGQVVIRNTGLRGTDRGQSVYQLACSVCGHVYGSNGSDIFERRCPMHDHGRPGLPHEGGILAADAEFVR